MTSLVLSPADETRRRGLRRMRTLALSLLLLAAVVFLLTLHRDGAWGFVNAAAEAAMVGALADWFAVTALFRHPMGVPVPHTAIIPNRKDALGQSLQEFVTDHFLTADVARDRVASADVARRLGRWLEDEGHSTRVVAEVATATGRALRVLHPDEVRSLVLGSMLPRLVEEPLSPVAGRLLEEIVRDGAHHGLVDIALVEAHSWLSANQRTVARVMAARAPWWSPQWLDDKVIDRVHHEALAWVADVRDNPRHPARGALDDLLSQLGRDLQDDPATMERFEAMKTNVLTHPQVGDTVIAVWESVRTALLSALADEDGPLRRRAGEALRSLGRAAAAGRRAACPRRRARHRRGRVGGRDLRPRDRHRDLHDREPLGRQGGRRADRAARRPRPAVHPDQRHRGRRPGGPGHPRRDAAGLSGCAGGRLPGRGAAGSPSAG